MAHGDYTYHGAVAHNFLPPNAKVTLKGSNIRSFFGRRRFRVEDTGPALRDGHFDIWASTCGKAIQWGKRPVRFRIGW
jgi:3D (Asp-Asp-Asp) domain-containing protein